MGKIRPVGTFLSLKLKIAHEETHIPRFLGAKKKQLNKKGRYA